MTAKTIRARILDYGIAIYVVAAFIMMIIPIPAVLMDILLAFDMALAFTIMFTSMFAREALDMSLYPTVLLIRTVFGIP